MQSLMSSVVRLDVTLEQHAERAKLVHLYNFMKQGTSLGRLLQVYCHAASECQRRHIQHSFVTVMLADLQQIQILPALLFFLV